MPDDDVFNERDARLPFFVQVAIGVGIAFFFLTILIVAVIFQIPLGLPFWIGLFAIIWIVVFFVLRRGGLTIIVIAMLAGVGIYLIGKILFGL